MARVWFAYGMAVALPLLTLALRQQLGDLFGTRPGLILFVLPVLLCALLGGFGPGLLSTGIAAAVVNYYVTEPTGSFRIARTSEELLWWIFIACGGLASILSGLLQRSRQREVARWKELVAAEGQLLVSKARYETAFEHAAAGMSHVSPSGQWLRVNRKLCDMLGYTEEELRARTFQDITHPEDLHDDLSRFKELLDGSIRSFSMEKRYFRKDGSTLWINLTVALIRKADGSPDYLASVIEDIDARKQAEAALLQSEAHYRAVVSALSEGVMVCDAQGRMLSCNAAAERITGVSLAEWQGHSVVAPGWTMLKHDGTQMPARESPPGRVLAGEGPQTDVLTLTRNAQGVQRWFDITSMPVHSHDTGALVSVVTSFTDVTQRQQLAVESALQQQQLEAQVRERTLDLQTANDALRDAARFNRALADNVPGNMSYWDSELRCRFANRGFLAWFGRSEADMLGARLEDCLGGDDLRRLRTRLTAGLQGVAQEYEVERAGADGRLEVKRVHIIPDRQPDRPVRGVYSISFDITALKQAQARLAATNHALAQARDAAETANLAKSAFLANMSHEIRTPMNAIVGLSHLMARESRSPAQAERLDKIDRAAAHLTQVIDDILDLSKIEAGKLALEEVDFPLDEVVSRSIDMVRAAASDKGLALSVSRDELPSHLRGDARRLAQALINLLANAVKFTHTGSIQLAVNLLAQDADRLKLRFAVRDTGEGIAESQQAALFNAFEQADNSSTRRHGGTGLGLALIRHFAHLMGGEVGLESAPGNGSNVWFTAWLGRSTLDDAPAPVPAAAPAPGDIEMQLRQRHAGQRVLLAEDNLVNQEVATELLRSVGLVVEAVGDGARAVEVALARHFDMVLMDVQMPVLDGLAASRELRARARPDLPIVAMTANAFHEDRAACRDAGMNDHVAKPVDPKQLYATLLRWLPRADSHRAGAALAARPEADPAPADRHERLQRIAGFDVAAALHNVGGRVPTLERVLRSFVAKYREGEPALLRADAPDRTAQWLAACHSLRGACVTIGASVLPQGLAAFEHELHQPADSAALAATAAQLDDELRSLVGRLTEALDA
jgi:two-component system, sensor histidine kinase and response regulator